MATKLFGRFRVRRGLKTNLPMTGVGSELLHCLDTQELFISNGSLAEGAPNLGVTQILTSGIEVSDVIEIIYTSNTPIIPQTGFTPDSPTIRTLQEVLNDFVSIKAFPVVGDGATDDSAGFNQAMTSLYTNNISPGTPPQVFWRKVFMPAGTYRMIANELLLPSRAHIVGEGTLSTQIFLDSTSSLTSLFQTADSLGQTGSALGSNSAELPQDILIENMSIVCNSVTSAAALFALNGVSNITFKNCYFSLANPNVGTMFNAQLMGTATTMSGLTFDNCEFNNYQNIFNFISNVSNVSMPRCTFNGSLPNFNNTATVTGNIQNTVTTAMPSINLGAGNTNTSIITLPLSASGNSAFINYTIIQSAAIRVGRLTLVSDGSTVTVLDTMTENAATNITFSAAIVSGNIEVQYTSSLSAATSVMRYSLEFWGNT